MPRKWYGFASFFRKGDDCDEVIRVKGVPLDDILETYSRIKLIKIDIEGAEYQVLEGARKSLDETTYIILEASMRRTEIINLLSEKDLKYLN